MFVGGSVTLSAKNDRIRTRSYISKVKKAFHIERGRDTLCCNFFEFVFCVSFRGANSGSDVEFESQYSAKCVILFSNPATLIPQARPQSSINKPLTTEFNEITKTIVRAHEQRPLSPKIKIKKQKTERNKGHTQ